MKAFRNAAAQSLIALSLLGSTAAQVSAQSNPPAAAVLQNNLTALADQALAPRAKPKDPHVIEYKSVAYQEARERMYHTVRLLALHNDTRKAFVDFVTSGGKIVVTDDPRYQQGYASYDPNENIIYMQAFKNKDLFAIWMAHELGHHKNHRLEKHQYEGAAISNHTIGGYLRKVFFDEAISQTLATDFAYEVFLKGNSAPLHALLNVTALVRLEEGIKSGSPAFYERIAKAYMGQLYKLTPDADIDLRSLPRMSPDRLAALRPKAQAAAFEAWFDTRTPPSSSINIYASKAIDDYVSHIRQVGKDADLQAYVQPHKPLPHIGSMTYGIADIEHLSVLNSVSFAKHIPAKVLQDSYIFDQLPPREYDRVYNVSASILLYKNGKSLPIQTMDPDVTVYSAAQADEYKAYPRRNLVDIADYFEAKKKGSFSDVEHYIADGNEFEMGINFRQYMQLKARGFLPTRAQRERERVDPILDAATAHRAQFLSASLRLMGDASLIIKGNAIVRKLETQNASLRGKDFAQREVHMQETYIALSFLINKAFGFSPRSDAFIETGVGFGQLGRDVMPMIWDFASTAITAQQEKFRPVIPRTIRPAP